MNVELIRVGKDYIMEIDGKPLLDGITGHLVAFTKNELFGAQYGMDNRLSRVVAFLRSETNGYKPDGFYSSTHEFGTRQPPWHFNRRSSTKGG